jgi:hypothetical protein
MAVNEGCRIQLPYIFIRRKFGSILEDASRSGANQLAEGMPSQVRNKLLQMTAANHTVLYGNIQASCTELITKGVGHPHHLMPELLE